jgi:penicillin-binding protein 1A
MYLNRVLFRLGFLWRGGRLAALFRQVRARRDAGEAALLAGLLKAPSRLSPARDPEGGGSDRAQLVLGAMREEGMIGDTELARPP